MPETSSELPPALLAETTPLISLVHHCWIVDHQLPLEELEKQFRDHGVDYLALAGNGRVTGIGSRANLGALLGSRFGFSLYARSPAHLVQVARPLIVENTMPVRRLLDLALGRPSGDFREDVALVDAAGALVGLIPVERLAHLQNQLVAEQVESLKTQHETLRRLERNAQRQEKQRLLDTLVGGIAHELNNKLTPILGLAEMLAYETGSDLIDHAALISRSAQEAARIIRQLLQLSKPDKFEVAAVDLRSVVEESLLMLKFKLRESKCAWRTRLPDAAAVTRADGNLLKQVMINLILNALDATENCDSPTIEIALEQGLKGWSLTVADNGDGIAPDQIGRIFDPFFTTKAPDKGTGLGLSISQSVVRQHGGEIAVASTVGVGTSFTVTLPVLEGVAEAPAPRSQTRPPEPSVRRRVLVVDDEEPVRVVLEEMLRSSLRCEVDLARNGLEGLEQLARRDYDLVISDIRMPVMTGTEFFLQVRRDHPGLVDRFVFITGHPGEQPLQDEIAGWGVAVVAKPFTLPRLIEICGPLLRRVAPVAA